MTDSRNIGQYSRLHSNPAGSGLVDGVDFPHSGILKAMSVGLQNSYAILNGTTADATKNFSIVQTDSSGNTQFVVRAGRIVRDGKLMPEISTSTFTQGTPSSFDEPTSGNAYFLLVATNASTNVLAIRGDKATVDVVPQLETGDIPIAILRLDYSGTVDNRSIQYLTTAKSENSVSIGFDAGSTTYTEVSAITGTNEGLFISGIGTATVQGADKVLIQDTDATGVNDVIKTVTAASIAALAPQGDITGITAGTGLTGTDLTGPVPTLNVGGLTVAELAANSLQISSESFANNDTSLMTSASIEDKIESYNYTTNVGDITGVALTAGTGIDLTSVANATAGAYAATIAVDVSDFMTNGANDRVLTATGTDGINAEADLTVGSGVIGINKSLVLSVAGATDFEPTVVNAIIDKSNNTSTTANNVINLPTAASVATRVFRLKNIHASTTLTINTANSNEKFDNGVNSNDTRWNSALQIELKPLESVLLQAVTDGVSIARSDTNPGTNNGAYSLTPGYLILDTVPKEIGDIESVVAGTGLTGGATSGVATLNVIGGDGITANADEIEVAVDDTTIELSASSGSGTVRVKDGGIATAKIADDAVTGAKLANNIDIAGTLDVTGITTLDNNLIVSGVTTLRANVLLKTAAFSATIAESGTVYQLTNAGAVVVTLPANPTIGCQYVFVNVNGNDMVITPTSGDIINGTVNNTENNTTAYAATSCVCVVGGGTAQWLVFGGI
tara:strand:+ start:2146 stop:4347 length:2202 start_codon:yes stop_codon:yes gene_type:complete